MSSGAIIYDWTQPEEKILVDMIRADNYDRPLTTAMLSFGQPEPLTPTEALTYNTRVLLSATVAAPFTGSQYHRYHRVDINNFVYPEVTNLHFIIQNYESVEEIVAELSIRLGVYLTSDKVIMQMPDAPGTYIVTVADHSLCYYGSLSLEFSELQYPLEEVIPAPNLAGFDT